jgi:hypothetical protein
VVIAVFELLSVAKDFDEDIVNLRLPMFNDQDMSGQEEDKEKRFTNHKWRYCKFSASMEGASYHVVLLVGGEAKISHRLISHPPNEIGR